MFPGYIEPLLVDLNKTQGSVHISRLSTEIIGGNEHEVWMHESWVVGVSRPVCYKVLVINRGRLFKFGRSIPRQEFNHLMQNPPNIHVDPAETVPGRPYPRWFDAEFQAVVEILTRIGA